MSESPTRSRTRRAILDAAVSVLACDPSASLGSVAAAAGVGRTTLHRYFAERTDLLAALKVHTLELVNGATERAALGSGPAVEALGRLAREYFELGDALTLIFSDPALSADWDEQSSVVELVRRGKADGSLDPELSAAWVENLVWALLYAAWALMREQGWARHEVLDQCLRSLHKAVAAP